jgi:hypothetical protein
MSEMPSNEVMAALTKMAIEQATALLAGKAREFAKNLPKKIGGREALEAFANSIDSTNSKMYPRHRNTNDG